MTLPQFRPLLAVFSRTVRLFQVDALMTEYFDLNRLYNTVDIGAEIDNELEYDRLDYIRRQRYVPPPETHGLLNRAHPPRIDTEIQIPRSCTKLILPSNLRRHRTRILH